jgi:sugar/nucleoside kinase (ribokinase family)
MTPIPDITAVGSVGLDTITTPVGTRAEVLGGSVTHFAMSASFQARVGMVGIVGDDFPAAHTQLLERHNVDLAGLEVVKGAQTFRWEGSYLKDLNAAETHCTALNVFATFRPTLPAAYRRAPVLFLANISPGLQLHVIAQMDSAAYRICDTMNLWIRETRAELCQVFERVQIAILNDGEARMFTGEGNLIKAGRAMLQFGLEYCVIKKGEHGALVFGKNDFFAAVPAFPVDTVVDPTGAGDSFAGGFVGCIARHGDHTHATIKEALRWGTVMGSFNVADFSCDRLRTLTRAEIEQRVAALQSFIG